MSIHALANSSPAIAQNAARSRIVAASELRGSAHQIGGSSTAGGAWRDPLSWLGPISVMRCRGGAISRASGRPVDVQTQRPSARCLRERCPSPAHAGEVVAGYGRGVVCVVGRLHRLAPLVIASTPTPKRNALVMSNTSDDAKARAEAGFNRELQPPGRMTH